MKRNLEIERKFLVDSAKWTSQSTGIEIRQGYIPCDAGRTVRVRINGSEGLLTLKGTFHNDSRMEYEYQIPIDDALGMLENLCSNRHIEKTRYEAMVRGRIWEIDVFHAENTGLILAEVELDFSGQMVAIPDWACKEVTGDPRFRNSYLAAHPYSVWKSRIQ
ncbi:MAG: CYTH domain-containing protein [Chloroflexi bacterium]|nr:CYTH domain-containing protein [Chloroflexota bacterium]